MTERERARRRVNDLQFGLFISVCSGLMGFIALAAKLEGPGRDEGLVFGLSTWGIVAFAFTIGAVILHNTIRDWRAP